MHRLTARSSAGRVSAMVSCAPRHSSFARTFSSVRSASLTTTLLSRGSFPKSPTHMQMRFCSNGGMVGVVGGGEVPKAVAERMLKRSSSTGEESPGEKQNVSDGDEQKLDPSKLKEVPLVFCGQTFGNPGQLSSWLMRWRVDEANKTDPESYYPVQEWEALKKLKQRRAEGNTKDLEKEWDNAARAGLLLKRAVLVTLEKLWLEKLGMKVVNTPQFHYLCRSIRIVEETLEMLKIPAPEHIDDDAQLPPLPEGMNDPMFTIPSKEQDSFAEDKLAKEYSFDDAKSALDRFVTAGNLLLMLRNQGMQMLPAYRNVQLHALNDAKIVLKAAANQLFLEKEGKPDTSPEAQALYKGGLPTRAVQQHLVSTVGSWLVMQNRFIVWLEQGHVKVLKPEAALSNPNNETLRKNWQQMKPTYLHTANSVLADMDLSVLQYMHDNSIATKALVPDSFQDTIKEQLSALKRLETLLVQDGSVEGLEVAAPLEADQKSFLQRHIQVCEQFLAA